jgi:hypothetical protein
MLRQFDHHELESRFFELGPEGCGVAVLPQAWLPEVCEQLADELGDSDAWYVPETYFSHAQAKDGITLDYEKFMLGVTCSPEGQRWFREKFPTLWNATITLQTFVSDSMAQYFGVLRNHRIDVVDLHRYSPDHNKLGRHRDSSEQLVGIADIHGPGTLQVIDDNGKLIKEIFLDTGDQAFMRAPGLFPSDDEIRPPHELVPDPDIDRIAAVFRMSEAPLTDIHLLPGWEVWASSIVNYDPPARA